MMSGENIVFKGVFVHVCVWGGEGLLSAAPDLHVQVHVFPTSSVLMSVLGYQGIFHYYNYTAYWSTV